MYKPSILFDQWNAVKKQLSWYTLPTLYINEREIRYVKLGINIWREQDGEEHFRRPVLVVKIIGSLYLTVPLTSKIAHISGRNAHYYHQITSTTSIKPSLCILSQVRVLDKSRFMHIKDIISEEENNCIKQKIRDLCL